jgi:energy-coupling factor transporter ATP-binding protein EcfA2
VIEVRGLTKRYGSTVAVDRLSFEVPPGAVTGFLGLNGSGKSTTMRMILGLDSPDAGHARIGGQPYRRLRWPLREAGGLLEPRAFHPGRPARAHLAALAASNAISQRAGQLFSWTDSAGVMTAFCSSLWCAANGRWLRRLERRSPQAIACLYAAFAGPGRRRLTDSVRWPLRACYLITTTW